MCPRKSKSDSSTSSAASSRATGGSKRARVDEDAWHRRRLPDRLGPNVRILFVGINPGARSARLGRHYAGHSNRFWKLVNESGLVPEPVGHGDDWRMPAWGYGLTNLVERPTSGSADLTRADYAAGRRRLLATIRRVRPHLVALVGVTLYRVLFPAVRRSAAAPVGLRDERLGGTPVFVLPNPSGRNAAYSYESMLVSFRELGRLERVMRGDP